MEYVNSKGVRWYLHKKISTIGRNKITAPTYFFRRIKTEGYSPLPIGYRVKETSNGLPVIKRL